MSAIERCPLFLSAIKRFLYKVLTMISSVLQKSVRYREVSAIKHVRYREVPLYIVFEVRLWTSANILILSYSNLASLGSHLGRFSLILVKIKKIDLQLPAIYDNQFCLPENYGTPTSFQNQSPLVFLRC